MDELEIIGLLTNVVNTVVYYNDPATDEGAVAVDRVALPAVLYAVRDRVEWGSTVLVESEDDLNRYYVGLLHVGTQRPA